MSEQASYKHDRFLTSCWGGIPRRFIRHPDGSLARERLAEMKEAGIDVVPVSGYGVAPYDRETVNEVLAECEKLGLRAQLADERIDRASLRQGYRALGAL